MPVIRLQAKFENMRKLMQFVSDFAKVAGFKQEKIREIELASEEALINIFSYAYPDKDTGEVEIRCKMKDAQMVIEFSDTGLPFDITSISEPDITANVSDRQIGGLGVHLIRKMVDDVRYRRVREKNILVFLINKIV